MNETYWVNDLKHTIECKVYHVVTEKQYITVLWKHNGKHCCSQVLCMAANAAKHT